MSKSMFHLGITVCALLVTAPLFAAKTIDLNQAASPQVLKSFFAKKQFAGPGSSLKSGAVEYGVDGTRHTRFTQTYGGVDVLGAEGVTHESDASTHPKRSLTAMAIEGAQSQTTMTGLLYADLNKDLAPGTLTKDKQELAIETTKRTYAIKKPFDKRALSVRAVKPVVYMTQTDTETPVAHWAYQITLYVKPDRSNFRLSRPTYIIDAMTQQVYEQYDEIRTVDHVDAGGFGGNTKMGKVAYGASKSNVPTSGVVSYLPSLTATRSASTALCALENTGNAEVAGTVVKDFRNGGDVIYRDGEEVIIAGETVAFPCQNASPFNPNLYWNEVWANTSDAENGGYSPSNDALYAGKVITDMYHTWYQRPVLRNSDKSPMQLVMLVHFPDANAFWDGKQMIFGDGIGVGDDGRPENLFYPLTSLDIAAHEVAHGYTQQHSNLRYYGHAGAINESFSDMAAQAAEFFVKGQSSWKIGHEVTRDEMFKNGPLRYMDQPQKDGVSIDHASLYPQDGMDPHYASGVFNRMFYLIATDMGVNKTGAKQESGFDTKKAFDIMIEAQNYWRPGSSFNEAACGVVKATRAYNKRYPGQYNVKTVTKAAQAVGLRVPRNC